MNVTEIEVSCLFSSTSVVKLEKMIVMAALKRYVNDTDARQKPSPEGTALQRASDLFGSPIWQTQKICPRGKSLRL